MEGDKAHTIFMVQVHHELTQLQNGILFSVPFLKILNGHLDLISCELILLEIVNPEIMFPR